MDGISAETIIFVAVAVTVLLTLFAWRRASARLGLGLVADSICLIAVYAVELPDTRPAFALFGQRGAGNRLACALA